MIGLQYNKELIREGGDQIPTLYTLAMRTVRRHIHRISNLCRAHLRSQVACIALNGDIVGMALVPMEAIEEILVAAPIDKLAACLRTLGTVNPMLLEDTNIDERYWKAAVERYYIYSTVE